MKRKILIIQLDQFGYLTDTYKWCEYLHSEFDIKIVCYDSKRPKVICEGVNVNYVQLSRIKILHALRFFLTVIFHCFFFNGKIIVVAFPNCGLLKRVLFWKKMHLDIRTVSVSRNEKDRDLYDRQLYKAGCQYDSVSVISDGVRVKLGLSNAFIIPLGSDVISSVAKEYSSINLLYVGTLNGRDIDKTIRGAYIFHHQHLDVDFHYDIIGEGQSNNGENLSDIYRNLVNDLQISRYVKVHGAMPYSELKPFFDKNNYGVSFVPITSWYDVQPPTKTFEYIMSGLYSISTKTKCNKEIVNDDNGILIDDTPESFAEAIGYILENSNLFCENKIRASLVNYRWDNIVFANLKRIL